MADSKPFFQYNHPQIMPITPLLKIASVMVMELMLTYDL